MTRLLVTVATRKGLWILEADARRRTWKMDGPHFLGQTVHHAVIDPRDRRTLVAAVKAGHLGHTVYRSEDFGRTWHGGHHSICRMPPARAFQRPATPPRLT